MTILTPDQAIAARESLKLSQAKVAKDTGINRGYLSQFEGSKRVFEDDKLTTLEDYYLGLGWQPDEATRNAPVDQLLNSDKHGLTIIDGFVVAPAAIGFEAERLLEEYYEADQEIQSLLEQESEKGLFGGLDQEATLKACYRPLVLMARQYEIQKIIQGQFEDKYHEADLEQTSSIRSLGDCIEALMKGVLPGRLLPSEAIEAEVV